MIWFRRAVALVLALLFVVLYVPLLVVFRINDTVGNPAFYIDQLRRADAYNFLYDRVLQAELDDLQAYSNSRVAGNIAVLKPEAIFLARKTIPPDWLQLQVEQVISKALPYLLGDTNSFQVKIPIRDQVVAGAAAIKETLHKPDIFASLYDQIMAQLVDAVAGNNDGNSLFMIDRQQLESAFRNILPADWLQQQMDGIIDQAVPYFTKDKDHFSVRIDISQRLDALQSVVVDVLKKRENYDRLMDAIASAAIGQSSSGGFQLPVGLVLNRDEVSDALKSSLSLDWYQSMVKDAVSQMFDYVKGNKSALEVSVSLSDQRSAIGSALASLADRKFQTYIDSLPACTPENALQMIANPPVGRLPGCRPLDLSYEQLKTLLRIDVQSQIAPVLTAVVPDRIVLTQEDFHNILGGAQEFLDRARDLVRQGWVVSDETLRQDLGPQFQSVEDIRQWVTNGVVFTEQDLRDWIADGSDTGQEQTTLNSFDRTRAYLGLFRHWKMVLWLIPALVLIAIGFLAGRRWSTRLLWAAGVLLATAVLTYVAIGPAFSSTVRPDIDRIINEAMSSGHRAEQVIAVKAVEVAHNSIDSFISGLQRQALLLLVTSLVLIALGVAMRLRGEHEHDHHYHFRQQ